MGDGCQNAFHLPEIGLLSGDLNTVFVKTIKTWLIRYGLSFHVCPWTVTSDRHTVFNLYYEYIYNRFYTQAQDPIISNHISSILHILRSAA